MIGKIKVYDFCDNLIHEDTITIQEVVREFNGGGGAVVVGKSKREWWKKNGYVWAWAKVNIYTCDCLIFSGFLGGIRPRTGEITVVNAREYLSRQVGMRLGLYTPNPPITTLGQAWRQYYVSPNITFNKDELLLYDLFLADPHEDYNSTWLSNLEKMEQWGIEWDYFDGVLSLGKPIVRNTIKNITTRNSAIQSFDLFYDFSGYFTDVVQDGFTASISHPACTPKIVYYSDFNIQTAQQEVNELVKNAGSFNPEFECRLVMEKWRPCEADIFDTVTVKTCDFEETTSRIRKIVYNSNGITVFVGGSFIREKTLEDRVSNLER